LPQKLPLWEPSPGESPFHRGKNSAAVLAGLCCRNGSVAASAAFVVFDVPLASAWLSSLMAKPSFRRRLPAGKLTSLAGALAPAAWRISRRGFRGRRGGLGRTGRRRSRGAVAWRQRWLKPGQPYPPRLASRKRRFGNRTFRWASADLAARHGFTLQRSLRWREVPAADFFSQYLLRSAITVRRRLARVCCLGFFITAAFFSPPAPLRCSSPLPARRPPPPPTIHLPNQPQRNGAACTREGPA
jgi:hypothetical protein